LLVNAPAVPGRERWRAIKEANALGEMKELADNFANVLLATVNELAFVAA